jgi:DNA repair protein RadA/Sms
MAKAGKVKTKYVCSECGYESGGYLGRCPACNAWNCMVEEVVASPGKSSRKVVPGTSKPLMLNEISTESGMRYTTGYGELNRVLGGGVVPGSLVLVGGDPGIGKSTLILQMCEGLGTTHRVLYVSGEESATQIKLRADRLGVCRDGILMLAETSFEQVEAAIQQTAPSVVIVDSIQTIYSDTITSAPGSVSQVREVTGQLLRIAKQQEITIFVVGHVTKEGAIAGPRVLEHMVDTVLYFEGERHQDYRILRAVKNRFGSTNEIGLFEMGEKGLIEVTNPSGILLDGRSKEQPGSVVAVSLEGTRPMLLEIQALVSPSSFNNPRRMATGLDYNRLTMLIAVLEKKVGMPLHTFDAYLNVVGGIRLDEPAADLGVLAAIVSSYRNRPVDPGMVFFGEVGLTGEVRAVGQTEKRIMEAARLGFTRCMVPASDGKLDRRQQNGIEVVPVRTVEQALELM